MKKAIIYGMSLALILSMTACGGSNDNAADNSQDTSTPEVSQSVDTSSQTEEEVKETLEVELPPVEVLYVRDYDTDRNGTISKDEWEKWCAEHPEDKNQNMHIEDSEKPQTQTPTVDTSGNPDPGSEQTSKPSTSKPSTSTPSTSKPSTSTPSTSKPSTSTPSTSTPGTSTPSTSTPADNGDNGAGNSNGFQDDDLQEWSESVGGYFNPDTGGGWLP